MERLDRARAAGRCPIGDSFLDNTLAYIFGCSPFGLSQEKQLPSAVSNQSTSVKKNARFGSIQLLASSLGPHTLRT